jgi:hypothetical protein
MKNSKKRELGLLIFLLLLFSALFAISFINLGRGLPVFGLGIGYKVENYLIAGMSFLSIVRILWWIIKH